jgi:hypothetical protein
MITETYTFPSPLVGYTSEAGSSFSQFNPALGTLNSVTVNATATATFSGGGEADHNEADYHIFLNSNNIANPFDMFAPTIGNGTADASIPDLTTTAGLGSYIGIGDVSTSVFVENVLSTIADISSTFGDETLTYNFTPAAAVPEPGSLSVLAIGLLGLGWAHRRLMVPEDHPVN